MSIDWFRQRRPAGSSPPVSPLTPPPAPAPATVAADTPAWGEAGFRLGLNAPALVTLYLGDRAVQVAPGDAEFMVAELGFQRSRVDVLTALERFRAVGAPAVAAVLAWADATTREGHMRRDADAEKAVAEVSMGALHDAYLALWDALHQQYPQPETLP